MVFRECVVTLFLLLFSIVVARDEIHEEMNQVEVDTVDMLTTGTKLLLLCVTCAKSAN